MLNASNRTLVRFVSLCALTFMTINLAYAQNITSPEKPQSSPNSISDETVGYDEIPQVLQNRYFTKKLRPEITVLGGKIPNDTFSDTKSYGVGISLYFTEFLGLEYVYSKFYSSVSTDLTNIQKLRFCNDAGTICKRPEPARIDLHNVQWAAIAWAPFYGKVDLMDLAILYSDIYFTAGASQLETSQGDKTALIFGVGQRFFFFKRFGIKIAATDMNYKEKRQYEGIEDEVTRNTWLITAGASLFLLN